MNGMIVDKKVFLRNKLAHLLMNSFCRLIFIVVSLFYYVPFMGAQTLRVLIKDADNGQPVSGASVALFSLLRQNPDVSPTITDDGGNALINNIVPGYYRCAVAAEGYEQRIFQEITISSGKETPLEVSLRRTPDALPELVIVADNIGRRRSQSIGETVLTRELTLRYPVTFFDPARLALAAPGVAGADDQANGFSVRGHTPNAIRWRLEGVDIANPNHLSGAGTFSDLPAPTSGGVLMFSAQMLDRSALLTGAFPAGYGDATGGIMDIYLRKGNAEQREFTVQAGLIGLDISAEGPFASNKKASYLANYRYSTVGLLGQMGVSFGNEQINFQDLSLHFHLPTAKAGTFAVFGMGGLSSNIYTHTADREKIKLYKELLDIDYTGGAGVAGMSHTLQGKKGTWLKTVLVASVQHNERTVISPYADIAEKAAETGTDTRIAGNTTAHKKISAQHRVQGGLNWSTRQFSGSNRNISEIYYNSTAEWLHFWQPWAEWEWSMRRTTVKGGLHTHIAGFNQAFSAEPRLLVAHRIGSKSRLTGSWGLYSEAQPMWLYNGVHNIGGRREQYNRNLDFTRSQQASARFEYQATPYLRLYSEAFWQSARQIPVWADGSSAFSMVNLVEGPISNVPLISSGKGRHYGLEMAAERTLLNGFFWHVNMMLLRATYTGSDGIWRDSRWNARYVANIIAGKEWQIDPKGAKKRAFGVSGRLNYREGFWDVRVAPDRNPFVPQPVRIADAPVYDVRLPYFLRPDLRVYWRRNIADRRNSTFSIDFQNMTARRNVAYYYYDALTQQTATKEQLGLIPNISWKLEF
jgi:hypothetical protein